MWSLLGLAVLVGMRHALEADHVAAVSSLAAGTKRMPDMIVHGLTWGFGHTATLLLFAGGALVLGHAIPETLAAQLEVAVGVMLICLGGHVLWRLRRDRAHFDDHRRRERAARFHAHSHAFEAAPDKWPPQHHVHRFNWRTLFIGMTHGMAGSAALLLLTVSQIGSPWVGLAYVSLFGIGSMLGMAAVSAAIGLPLALTAQCFTPVNRGLQAMVGATTVIIGASSIHMTIFTAS